MLIYVVKFSVSNSMVGFLLRMRTDSGEEMAKCVSPMSITFRISPLVQPAECQRDGMHMRPHPSGAAVRRNSQLGSQGGVRKGLGYCGRATQAGSGADLSNHLCLYQNMTEGGPGPTGLGGAEWGSDGARNIRRIGPSMRGFGLRARSTEGRDTHADRYGGFRPPPSPCKYSEIKCHKWGGGNVVCPSESGPNDAGVGKESGEQGLVPWEKVLDVTGTRCCTRTNKGTD